MAEINLIGGMVGAIPNALPRERGISEVFSGNIFPVVVAGIGGRITTLAVNLNPASAGMHDIIPGVHQGVLAAGIGGLVDFTDWAWKTRFPPWCGFDPPLVRRLAVWLTPKSNDLSGGNVRLHIDWGDGIITERCQSGATYRHDYAGMGRYTLTVGATNTLGDGTALTRDVVVVDYPEGSASWRYGQSPGSSALEQEP